MATKDLPKDRDEDTRRGKDHGVKEDKDALEPTPQPAPPGLMPYLAESVREADPKQPATKDVPHAPLVRVYLAEDVEARLRAPGRWKQAVIEPLMTAGIYRPAHDDDPRRAVNDLMNWAAREESR